MDTQTSQSSYGDGSLLNVTFERERGVHAIRVTHDVAHAVMNLDTALPHGEGVQKVLHLLNDAQVPLFLIKLHRTAVTAGLAGAYLPRLEAGLEKAGIRFRTRRDLALIIVRAAQMRETSGVMVQIADALAQASATLFETGDSHNSVQCLIEAERVGAVIDTLCQMFHLDKGVVQETQLTEESA